ncbi:hypothetical protein [uncultured Amphritea sp.]|uniref:hypothetical protein n=1 Tax=uncultured Amphritea sp. TaxID=981605 RepID=UPI00261C8B55|nr:hypothetical protein [uncultured Amphritea sp.]
MSQNNTNKFRTSNSRQGVASTPYSEVLDMVLSDLDIQAQSLISEVFKTLDISNQELKNDYLEKALQKAKEMQLPVEKDKTTELTQSKVAIKNQITYHTNQSLLNATWVMLTYSQQKNRPPTGVPQVDIISIKIPLDRAIKCLTIAQRNLASLEILKKLEKKLYTARGQKGGYAKNKLASKSDEQHLLETMVKNILYNEPNLHSMCQKDYDSSNHVCSEISNRIYEVNKVASILEFNHYDKIKNDIRNIIVTKLRKGRGNSWANISDQKLLSRNLSNFSPSPARDSIEDKIQTKSEEIKAEIEDQNRYIDGLLDFLKFLIKEKFGEPSVTDIISLRKATTEEEIKHIYYRINETDSWESLLEIKAK